MVKDIWIFISKTFLLAVDVVLEVSFVCVVVKIIDVKNKIIIKLQIKSMIFLFE